MKIKFLTFVFVILCCGIAAGAQECGTPGSDSHSPGMRLEGFRQLYFTGGVPIDGTAVDKNSSDVKFQVSFACPLFDLNGYRLKLGYTQKAVWNVLAYSSPFKDNMYIPGIYLDFPAIRETDKLLLGIEHRSNGRNDAYSRSVNILFGEYTLRLPCGLSLQANVRGGFGWYIDDLTRDIFSKFHGYATFGAMYGKGRFTALYSATPLSGSPCRLNSTAELSLRLGKESSSMYHLFMEYHHGYDECFCDCVYGFDPGHTLRFGILVAPQGINRLSR